MAILRRGHGRAAVKPHQLWAIGAGLLFAGFALLANLGRLAETPAAGSVGVFGSIGPGKLGQLRGMKLDRDGTAPKGIDQAARRALVGAPLAYEPFFGVAAAAFRDPSQHGSPSDAALLREALRRNPRSREARLLLMRHAVGKGDLQGAIGEMAVLNRLNGGAIEQLMIGLGNSISSEHQIDEAVAALKPNPDLYPSFVRGFRLAKKPHSLATRLVSQLPSSALSNAQVREDATFLMMQAQAFSEARKLWASGLKNTGGDLVYSPNFKDAKAPPPFNWDLMEDETGVAERTATGLSARYYGRSPGVLVSQLLTLAPGRYSASIEYRTTDGTPGVIALHVRCADQDFLIAEILLDGGKGVDRKGAIGFAIPATGCSGQTIALVGRALDNRDPHEVEVRSITVNSGGAK